MWLRLRNVEKKRCLSFPPPWEFHTPISSWGTPRLLINLPRNRLSQYGNRWKRNFVGESIGRTDAEAETPVLWPPHVKNWLIGKDSDAGRDWGQEEKGTTEDEMAGWHHRLDGHESEWTPGVDDGQGGLACCNSWGCKESDMTERLNWTDTVVYAEVYFQFTLE